MGVVFLSARTPGSTDEQWDGIFYEVLSKIVIMYNTCIKINQKDCQIEVLEQPDRADSRTCAPMAKVYYYGSNLHKKVPNHYPEHYPTKKNSG
jgi:hypothetical protein